MVATQTDVSSTKPPERSARDQLKSVVERIERLAEDKDGIAQDIKEIYDEAKGQGFDVKALRTVIRMRRQNADERREQETIVEQYMAALGML